MLLQQSIIIVDDDPGMGRAIQRVLGAAGWNATVFMSGEDLLESDILRNPEIPFASFRWSVARLKARHRPSSGGMNILRSKLPLGEQVTLAL